MVCITTRWAATRSHPTGVRGLKCIAADDQIVAFLVVPHWGAWIEIWLMGIQAHISPVAPHWGAWIEIRSNGSRSRWAKSHPTGVRGLKQRRVGGRARGGRGRTPLGCVD